MVSYGVQLMCYDISCTKCFIFLFISTTLNKNALYACIDGVCGSMDIRNAAYNLNALRGCRVIKGFLIFTLIDKYNETDYNDMVFPELTEVTDFVLLYRVNGLKSVGKLFPNLRIIRGNDLIHGFSFVVFEMMHLEEIGLKSLLKINRGAVRIEKNPVLCFVETIDWSTITSANAGNVIRNNKAVNECPVCPNGVSDENNIMKTGPQSTQFACPEVSESKRFCWNRSTCQQSKLIDFITSSAFIPLIFTQSISLSTKMW